MEPVRSYTGNKIGNAWFVLKALWRCFRDIMKADAGFLVWVDVTNYREGLDIRSHSVNRNMTSNFSKLIMESINKSIKDRLNESSL